MNYINIIQFEDKLIPFSATENHLKRSMIFFQFHSNIFLIIDTFIYIIYISLDYIV